MANGRKSTRPSNLMSESRSTGETTRLGLCATCDMLEECRRPKPEGGIWRCAAFADTYEQVFD